MVRTLLFLGVTCAAVLAQDADLAERVERLERLLNEERARGEKREQRVTELEDALRRATEALASSQDRRGLEEEIERILDEREPEVPASRLNIGAVLVGSARATEFTGPNFELERRYIRLVYRFNEQITARYYTDGSLAELELADAWFKLNVGVVAVPFGQFNARSFSDTFDTLSRPLMYLGDEDVVATPANNPRPLFRSLYSDTGIVASMSSWGDASQFYFALFVTNGLGGLNEPAGDSSSSDNNENKQTGLRLAYSERADQTRVGVGVSALGGKYDPSDSLSHRMYGVDLLVVREGLFEDELGSVTLRGEYVYAPREIAVFTATTRREAESILQGAYLLVEVRFGPHWMAYAGTDWLAQHAPLLAGTVLADPAGRRTTSRNWRYTVGLVHKFEIGIVWKFEFAFWDFDQGFHDVSQVATQIVVAF